MLAWRLQDVGPQRTHNCMHATYRLNCQPQPVKVSCSAISFAQTAYTQVGLKLCSPVVTSKTVPLMARYIGLPAVLPSY